LDSRKIQWRGYWFQDDNAPVHTARGVKAWILQNRIKVLQDWPSQSPDLNPIENLWSELERQLKKHTPRPKNKQDLFSILQEEWNAIPTSKYIKLIESMPQRIQACIESDGGPIKY